LTYIFQPKENYFLQTKEKAPFKCKGQHDYGDEKDFPELASNENE